MALTTTPPPGYKPDPTMPAGFTPVFNNVGSLYGYLDPNGVNVSPDVAKTAVRNDDGTIYYPANARFNGGVMVSRPDGTSSITTPQGLTTNYAASTDGSGVGKAIGTVHTDSGAAATSQEISDANNTANGKIGGGGLLGLGSNPVIGTIDAIKALKNQAGLGDIAAPTIDTSGVTSALGNSKALQDKFTSAYDASQPGVAPTITAAQARSPSLVTYLAQKDVASATPGQVGSIPLVDAPTIGAAPTATAGQAVASQIDTGPQSEFRGTQQNLIGYLNDAITGKAPSVAELQLRDAEQRQEANQLGLASRASGGGNVALAMRNAANNIGRLNQAQSADAALLRAKEIADARGQLGSVADQARTGDISLAEKAAELGTGVSQTNAGLLTQASTTNASNLTALLAKQAELRYQASHDNAGNALSAAETNAKLQTDASLAAALAKNNADLQTQRLSEESSASNAQNRLTTDISNTKATNDAATSNATNTLTQRQIDEKNKQDAASNALTASGQGVQGSVGLADAQAKIAATQADVAKSNRQNDLDVWKAGGQAAAVASDRRRKTDIEDGTAGAQALLDHLSAKSFRYKDGGHSVGERPGRLTGVMAQDVEKSPAGKPLVLDTPKGKMIDTVASTGTVMAMLATLNKRLKNVEGARV